MTLTGLSRLWRIAPERVRVSGSGFRESKNKTRIFLKAVKEMPSTSQNGGQTTKSVTVKVTKSVVLTGRRATMLDPIGRCRSSLTGLELND